MVKNVASVRNLFTLKLKQMFCTRFCNSHEVLVQSLLLRSSSSDSFTLAYQCYGEGRSNSTCILTIHGMLGSKRNWNSFCKTLSEVTKRQVIAVDCRNHGESSRSENMTYPAMALDVANTLQTLQIPKCILIGHSMGGRIAMETALSMPSIVEMLVVVDIMPRSTSDDLSMVPMVLSAMLALNLAQIKSRKDADELLKESIPSDGLRAWVLTNLYKDKNGYFNWFPNLKSIKANQDVMLEGIDVSNRRPFAGKSLFIGGDESNILRNVDMNDVRQLFPNARLEMIKGAGHFVHADKPKEFLQTVTKFLH